MTSLSQVRQMQFDFLLKSLHESNKLCFARSAAAKAVLNVACPCGKLHS